MKKHSITIAGHQTSITLEEPFWIELQALAKSKNLSINKLVAQIDAATPEPKNLSSAIRIHVLNSLKNVTE